MATIITLALEKGGVLKTTTTVNLAYALANLGYKVGVIDFDNQKHAGLNLNPIGGIDLATALSKKSQGVGFDISDFSKTSNPNLFVIQNKGNVGLGMFSAYPDEERAYLLADYLEQVENRLDYILIDTPPSIELQTINALIASDYVISPCTLEIFAVSGLQNLLNKIKDIQKRLNPRLKFLGVLITKYNRSLSENWQQIQNIKDIVQSEDMVFKTIIRQNAGITQAQNQSMTVYESSNEKGREDFDQLAKELISKLN